MIQPPRAACWAKGLIEGERTVWRWSIIDGGVGVR